MQIAVVVETAEPREVMHFALLFGYGATAINPYLSFAVLDDLVKKNDLQLDFHTAEKNYVKSINKGLLKVLSKMGISTLRSYRGAQIFEAVGIASDVLNKYFRGTTSRIEGIGIEDIAKESIASHKKAFLANDDKDLENKGLYAYRKDGEYHAWNPETISTLQLATRLGSYKKFKEYTNIVDNNTKSGFPPRFHAIQKRKSIPIEKC